MDYLRKKGINLSWRTYFIDCLGAMAFGLFASLLVGTILNSLGQSLHISYFTDRLWPIAQKATGAAIAVSIATSLSAPNLVLFASTIVGIGAYELGGPVGVFLATIFGVEFGKLVSKSTKLDIIVTPTVTIIVGLLVGDLIGPYVSSFMTAIGLLGGAAAILAGVSVVTLRELSAQHKARSEAKAAEKEQHTGK